MSHALFVRDFFRHVAILAGQPAFQRARDSAVHVLVDNLAPHQRPSTAVIAVDGRPDLPIVVTHLQGAVADRHLLVGRQAWPAGVDSDRKRRLVARIDAFLAAFLDVPRPLPRPLLAVERAPRRLESRRAGRAPRLIRRLAERF